MKNKSLAVVFILLCLTGGAFIYFVSRPESVHINHWLLQIGHGKFLLFFRTLSHTIQLPAWVIYSLPDA
ncbi:MAG: hypothetical protein ABIQ02_08295, partial [Saprospiraceae bacterium]